MSNKTQNVTCTVFARVEFSPEEVGVDESYALKVLKEHGWELRRDLPDKNIEDQESTSESAPTEKFGIRSLDCALPLHCSPLVAERLAKQSLTQISEERFTIHAYECWLSGSLYSSKGMSAESLNKKSANFSLEPSELLEYGRRNAPEILGIWLFSLFLGAALPALFWSYTEAILRPLALSFDIDGILTALKTLFVWPPTWFAVAGTSLMVELLFILIFGAYTYEVIKFVNNRWAGEQPEKRSELDKSGLSASSILVFSFICLVLAAFFWVSAYKLGLDIFLLAIPAWLVVSFWNSATLWRLFSLSVLGVAVGGVATALSLLLGILSLPSFVFEFVDGLEPRAWEVINPGLGVVLIVFFAILPILFAWLKYFGLLSRYVRDFQENYMILLSPFILVFIVQLFWTLR